MLGGIDSASGGLLNNPHNQNPVSSWLGQGHCHPVQIRMSQLDVYSPGLPSDVQNPLDTLRASLRTCAGSSVSYSKRLGKTSSNSSSPK
jgi:hypothetical protein